MCPHTFSARAWRFTGDRRHGASRFAQLLAEFLEMLRESVPWVGGLGVAPPVQTLRHVHPAGILANHAQRCLVERRLRMKQYAARERRVVRVPPEVVPLQPLLLRPGIALVDDNDVGGLRGEVAARGFGAGIADR